MGSGASATEQRYAHSTSLSKSFSGRKAGQVLCNRCGQQVGSSKIELCDRPLCHKCGQLCQSGQLYVCSVCDEIHKYSKKGGARTRVCSTCASLKHNPNQACTRCGEIRKIADTPSARGRCVACWMRGGSGLSGDLQLSLPEEKAYGLPVGHYDTGKSTATTKTPRTPASSLGRCDTLKSTATTKTPRTPAARVEHYASEKSTATTKTPRTPAARVEHYASEKSTTTTKTPRSPASRVVSASIDSNPSGVLASNASRRTASRVGSASLDSNPSGALTKRKTVSRVGSAALDSNPSGAFAGNAGALSRSLRSATVMETGTTSTSTSLTAEETLTTTLKEGLAVAAEKSLPVGVRGLLLSHSSTSSLGSFNSVTLASAVTAKTLLATTSEEIHRFRRRHKAARSTQPGASRPKTAPSNSKPESSKSSITLPALAQTVHHLDRKVNPCASDPLAEYTTDDYHIGSLSLGDFKKHKKAASRRTSNSVTLFSSLQRIRLGLVYGGGRDSGSE